MIYKVAIWIYSSAASEIATGGLQTRCLALVRDYHKCPDTALSAVIGGECTLAQPGNGYRLRLFRLALAYRGIKQALILALFSDTVDYHIILSFHKHLTRQKEHVPLPPKSRPTTHGRPTVIYFIRITRHE